MNILSIDTATEILRLGVQTENAFLENTRAMGLKHAETLIPLIDSMLEEAGITANDLNLVVCSQGPGSFTGLRIGMATAKGIAEGAECPLVSVSTLRVIAEPYRYLVETVVPVIDAKKQRFYARVFREGAALTNALDIRPEDLADELKELKEAFIVGPGAEVLQKKLEGVHLPPDVIFLDPLTSATSRDLIRLGQARLEQRGPDQPESGPIYLRPSEAELGRKQDKE